MATFSRDGIRARVNEYIDTQLESQYVQLHPIVNLLSAYDDRAAPYDHLGRPNYGHVFGHGSMDSVEQEQILGTLNHHFPVVKTESEGATGVEHGGETATASGFAEENIGTYETRWTHLNKGVRMNKHNLESLAAPGGRTADAALTTHVKKICSEPFESFVKSIHQRFWTDSPTASEQNATTWTKLLGLQHTLTNDNVYGRVNRSSVTGMETNVIDASTDFYSPVPDLRMIRNVNSGFQRATAGTQFLGLKARSGVGAGAQCIVTTPELWQELADQIDSRYHIDLSTMPDHGLGGFKADMIYYQGTYITWDQLCPAGEMYMLALDSFLLEVAPDMNMQMTTLVDKSTSEEGGGYYLWGRFDWKVRFSNRAFWKNARITNLETSS